MWWVKSVPMVKIGLTDISKSPGFDRPASSICKYTFFKIMVRNYNKPYTLFQLFPVKNLMLATNFGKHCAELIVLRNLLIKSLKEVQILGP